MNVWPKYIEFPDWCWAGPGCTDEYQTSRETPFMKTFWEKDSSNLMKFANDNGFRVLFHNHRGPNECPTVIFKINSEEALKNFQELLYPNTKFTFKAESNCICFEVRAYGGPEVVELEWVDIDYSEDLIPSLTHLDNNYGKVD